jgi:AmpD protein
VNASLPADLSIDHATGLLSGVRQVLSTHFDARPAGVALELIVVHGISLPPGDFGGPWIEQLFAGSLDCTAHPYFGQLAGERVSAHVLLRRDGTAVQFVPFSQRAWHAGVSSWRGRSACNDFSVGIELEGTDQLPYEPAQYRSLAALIRSLRRVYPSLEPDGLAGHADIAPGRKTDPGDAFDWSGLAALLA